MHGMLRTVLIGVVLVGVVVAAAFYYIRVRGVSGEKRVVADFGVLEHIDPGLLENITDKGYAVYVSINKTGGELNCSLEVYPVTGNMPVVALRFSNSSSPDWFNKIVSEYHMSFVIDNSRPMKLSDKYWYWEYNSRLYNATLFVAGNSRNTVVIGLYRGPVSRDFAIYVVRTVLATIKHSHSWGSDKGFLELVNRVPQYAKNTMGGIAMHPGEDSPVIMYGKYSDALPGPEYVVAKRDQVKWIKEGHYFSVKMIFLKVYLRVIRESDGFLLGRTLVFEIKTSFFSYVPLEVNAVFLVESSWLESTMDISLDITLYNAFDKSLIVKEIVIPDLHKTINVNTVLSPGQYLSKRYTVATGYDYDSAWEYGSRHTIIVKYKLPETQLELQTSAVATVNIW